MGSFTYYVIICELENLVPFGHKELWRPPVTIMGSSDFKDVDNSVIFATFKYLRGLSALYHINHINHIISHKYPEGPLKIG